MVRIYIPVNNTTSGNFTYDRDISTEDLIRLQDEQFMRTNRNIEGLMHGGDMRGVRHELFDPVSNRKVLDVIDMVPVLCTVKDRPGGCEIPYGWYDEVVSAGRMSIMNVNVHGKDIEYDAEEEIRFWIADSALVLDDMRLDQRTRLNTLPVRDLELETPEGRYALSRCKIVERYKGTGYPYSFTIIVEKIKAL